MTKASTSKARKRTRLTRRTQGSPTEAQLRVILEEARQRVKPISKKELESEQISPELLNFRFFRASR